MNEKQQKEPICPENLVMVLFCRNVRKEPNLNMKPEYALDNLGKKVLSKKQFIKVCLCLVFSLLLASLRL